MEEWRDEMDWETVAAMVMAIMVLTATGMAAMGLETIGMAAMGM